MRPAQAITGLQLLPLSAALRSSGNGVLQQPEMAAKRVAIIGAGAGGSSAAYHLSQNAKEAGIPADIHVFERSARVGGRCTTVNAWNDPTTPVELGASIFVEVNHILVEAAKTFNLSADSKETTVEGVPDLGVWNGHEFVVITESGDSWWDKAKLLWRYGWAPIKTNRLMKETVGKFLKMYEAPLFPWKSLTEVTETVGLTGTFSSTGEQFLKQGGIGDLFATEIIQASTRVNYAQNLGLIHGLETMVCMATNGAMAIDGGNYQIFENMVNSSSTISTHLNTQIAKVSKQSDNTYNLTTKSGETSNFDTVIIATPLQFSELDIDPRPKHVPDVIPYVKLHVTLFASPHRLDPKAFNLDPDKNVPQYVLTTLPPGENPGADPNGVGAPGFLSISNHGSGINPHTSRSELLYKIFSPMPINATFLSHILGKDIGDGEAKHGSRDGAVSWIYHKTWHSYPYMYPRVTFDEIRLDGDGLWYTSAIESFISTMETSALMGKNVAKLVANGWVEGKEGKVEGEGDWAYVAADQKPLKAKL
ncbi:prenylcysteine oxidase-like protein 1 precursor [Corynespora cassiicola Philippines]|uniref:Prenylcysteine oxidase-like protein 1 n=1 Tax=Corynespora cassiicola Philippines TaxID=1448308 RepID=A0A2T2NBH2_CORCC|nr:prenylcysteine oxidase-like protein 1 precursor [Corynespora cassiicola Philippines]